MSTLAVLLVIWAVITAALVIVAIYRSVVSLHEDDQLFLSSGEAQLAREQQQVVAQLNRTAPYARYLGVASAALAAVIIGVWLYQGFTRGGAVP